MIPRLTKFFPVNASRWKSSQPLIKHLSKEISIFWNKPRIDDPIPAAREGHWVAKTIEVILVMSMVGSGTVFTVDLYGRKSAFVKQAMREWSADRDDQEIRRMGKWAWVLRRATEMEKEKRREDGWI